MGPEKKLTDADILVGGPMGKQINPQEPEKEEATQETTAEKIIVGGKEFATVEEATAFYRPAKQQQAAAPVQHAAPQAAQSQDVDPADILFEDPKTALRLVEERAYSRAKTEIKQEAQYDRNRDKMWVDFYDKNKDLAQMKGLVDGEFARRFSELQDLPVDHALDIIAASARKTVGEVKRATTQATRLPSGPAKVSSASGSPSPSVPAAKPVAKTFVEEVLEARKRKA